MPKAKKKFVFCRSLLPRQTCRRLPSAKENPSPSQVCPHDLHGQLQLLGQICYAPSISEIELHHLYACMLFYCVVPLRASYLLRISLLRWFFSDSLQEDEVSDPFTQAKMVVGCGSRDGTHMYCCAREPIWCAVERKGGEVGRDRIHHGEARLSTCECIHRARDRSFNPYGGKREEVIIKLFHFLCIIIAALTLQTRLQLVVCLKEVIKDL